MYYGLESKNFIHKNLVKKYHSTTHSLNLRQVFKANYNLLKVFDEDFRKRTVYIAYHVLERFEERFGPCCTNIKIFREFIWKSRFIFKAGIYENENYFNTKNDLGLKCKELNLFIPICLNNNNKHFQKFFFPTCVYLNESEQPELEIQCEMQDFFDKYHLDPKSYKPSLLKNIQEHIDFLKDKNIYYLDEKDFIYLIYKDKKINVSCENLMIEMISGNLRNYLDHLLKKIKS